MPSFGDDCALFGGAIASVMRVVVVQENSDPLNCLIRLIAEYVTSIYMYVGRLHAFITPKRSILSVPNHYHDIQMIISSGCEAKAIERPQACSRAVQVQDRLTETHCSTRLTQTLLRPFCINLMGLDRLVNSRKVYISRCSIPA